MKKRGAFLDRDGVINKALVIGGAPFPPRNLKEVEILSGVQEAINLLFQNSIEIIIVTNQPDVARGVTTQKSVESINEYLLKELGIRHSYVCFHDDPEGCNCRKPKPGLLLTAAKDLDLDLKNSFMVGDRWRDIAAGQAVGCKCFFVDYGYAEIPPQSPYTRVASLNEAVHLMIGED